MILVTTGETRNIQKHLTLEAHTMTSAYSYQETLQLSEKSNWRVEDLIGGDKRLDFTRPFLPESLARLDSMDFLTSEEKVLLNHLRISVA